MVYPDANPFQPHPQFVTMVHPLGCTSKKDTDEVRPYIDPTITGLNEAMAPVAMRLPKIDEILQLLQPGWALGKRDWRHGFYHCTLHQSERPHFGFRLPDGRLARFKAMPFGASQAPMRFTRIAVEFCRLLTLRLQASGYTNIIIVQYVDDCFIAADTHTKVQLVFREMDLLAAELGV